MLETHARLGQGVDVGRLDDGIAIASQGVLAQLVAHEEKDVGQALGHDGLLFTNGYV